MVGLAGCVVGMSSHIAYRVTLPDTAKEVPAAMAVPVCVVAQPTNLFPAGAKKAQLGSVYAPAGTPVAAAILPLPPLALKVTV